MRIFVLPLALLLLAAPGFQLPLPAQSAATSGPVAISNDQRAAAGYLKTVVNAQKVYKKKRGSYAPTLAALVGSGSFTKRMAAPERGGYRVSYRATANGYAVSLTPKVFDGTLRAYFTDQTGKIRVEEGKAATASSELLLD